MVSEQGAAELAGVPDGAPNGAEPMAEDGAPGAAWDPREDLPAMPGYALAHTLAGHARAVASVKFSRRGGLLASASADGTARVWHADTGQLWHTLAGHTKGLSDVCWNREGTLLATASDDRTLRLWDAEAGRCLHSFEGHTHYIYSCCFSEGGNLLASGSFDETIRLWDVRSAKCLKSIPGHSDPVTCVDFNADEADPAIASSSFDGLARLWRAGNGKCLQSLMDRDSPPMSFVRFTPNSKFLLVGTLNSRLSLWDFVSKKVKKVYTGHRNLQYCLQAAFLTSDPSGTKYVVSGSEDSHIYFWELNHPKNLFVLRGRPSADAPGDGHVGPVLSVAANPNAAMLATAGYEQDCTVKIWKHSGGGSGDEAGRA